MLRQARPDGLVGWPLSRPCVPIQVGPARSGEGVAALRHRLPQELGGVRGHCRVYNGRAFASKTLDREARNQPVTLGCARPGKPAIIRTLKRLTATFGTSF